MLLFPVLLAGVILVVIAFCLVGVAAVNAARDIPKIVKALRDRKVSETSGTTSTEEKDNDASL